MADPLPFEICLTSEFKRGFTVMKIRDKNNSSQKGKSGGYRLIYWHHSNEVIVLLDIYSKSDQTNIDAVEICQIIKRFNSTAK